jgi:hypothetical protein
MRAASRGEALAKGMWDERVALARERAVSPLWLGRLLDVAEEA